MSDDTISGTILEILRNHFIDVPMYERRPNRCNDSPMIRMNLKQIVIGLPDTPAPINLHDQNCQNTVRLLLKRRTEDQPSSRSNKKSKLIDRVPTVKQNQGHQLESIASVDDPSRYGDGTGGRPQQLDHSMELDPISSEDDLSQYGDRPGGRPLQLGHSMRLDPVSSEDDMTQYGDRPVGRIQDLTSDYENIESDDEFSRNGSNSSQDSIAENSREL